MIWPEIEVVLTGKEASKHRMVSVGKCEYAMILSNSETTDLSYLRLIKRDALAELVRQEMLPMIVTFLVFGVLVVVVFAWIIAIYNYMPIRNLYHLFSRDSNVKEKVDELSFIKKYVFDLIESNHAMKQKMQEKDYYRLKDMMVDRLYEDGDSKEEDEELLSLLGIELKKYEFAIIMLLQQHGKMTLHQKLAQLFCVNVNEGQEHELEDMIECYGGMPGAVMYRPMPWKNALHFTGKLMKHAEVPMRIAANLEKGGSGIIKEGVTYSSPMEVSATDDDDMAEKLAVVCAREAAAVGVNWTFAPIIDIDYNYNNPITNIRTFGSDPERVARMGKRYVETIQEMGIAATIKHFPGDGVDERDLLRGVSRMESLEIILRNYEGETLSQEEKEIIAEDKNAIYRELLEGMNASCVSEEVRNTLEILRQRGYRIAVGSSSKNAKFILEKIDLLKVFDGISDGNNIKRSKQDPEVFLKAAQYIGLEPKHCLVVEDAEAGIEAAIAAGMYTAAIGGAAANTKSDYLLKKFSDLLDI